MTLIRHIFENLRSNVTQKEREREIADATVKSRQLCMSMEFSRFQGHAEQVESEVHPQMRLAATERSFNESYPRALVSP